ncbi:MAG: DUF1836 domain-containing protein [Traorella sp.]
MEKIHLPRWEELPKIDLYIDQVVTLLQQWLSFLPCGDVITKSMINNYVKHGIVDAPKKKKYTATHLAYLIVVCIFKQVYSMNEITQMIRLQVHAYPIDLAYNYFIEDFEKRFNGLMDEEPKYYPTESDNELSNILHSVNESLVHKFKIQKLLQDLNNEQ